MCERPKKPRAVVVSVSRLRTRFPKETAPHSDEVIRKAFAMYYEYDDTATREAFVDWLPNPPK